MFQSRIRIASILVVVFAALLILKLFFLQIIDRNFYMEKADKQYSTPSGDIFNRGSIFFTKKDASLVAAATITSGYKIALNTKDITDPEALYNVLTPYITMDHDTFIAKASKKNDPYEEVMTRLTKQQADEVSLLREPGVSIYKDNWRFYPGGNLAAQTLGFLAYKGNDKIGQYGLERFYNTTLSKPKNQPYVNFFAEVFSNIKSAVSTDDNQGDIVTTIEPSTQHTLESELATAMTTWHADQAGGVIINPMTGEIYAIAGLPDFDLNNFGTVTNNDVYRNPIVENVFEFGSVIKPLVMAAAIDQNVVTPDTTYFDKGSVIVDKKVINNFDLKGRGLSTMQTVLDQSLNTGMVFVAAKLGHDNIRNYMKAYGLGDKTGIDLPNETSGLIKNIEKSPRDLEYANAAFGQGIAITPIEAVRAFSVIANGGNIIVPHLVKQIRYDDGISKVIEAPIVRQGIIKKESATTITRMLVHVFETYDGGGHKFEHYSVASKTGTAQIAIPGVGGYYPDRHTHSFFGYFPAYDPKFLVFLFLKNPKEVKYASQTLIPPFINITKFLMNYYDVPPDR